eukprot:6284400-Pyramimonas_sp.AAC.1
MYTPGSRIHQDLVSYASFSAGPENGVGVYIEFGSFSLLPPSVAPQEAGPPRRGRHGHVPRARRKAASAARGLGPAADRPVLGGPRG